MVAQVSLVDVPPSAASEQEPADVERSLTAPIFLLTAVRNEANVIGYFLHEIHKVFGEAGLLSRTHLVMIDDCSLDDTAGTITRVAAGLPGLSVEVVSMASNRGNQAAMAYGVRQLAPRLQGACLLTFDADGEDDLTRLPDLVRLLNEDPSRMIFVYRDGRKERLMFQVFYGIYRLVYRLLAGQRLIPCNIMAIPGWMVPMVAGSPLLSLHFSYPPLRLGLPYRAIPMARRARYGGESTQNISLLIQHGLIGLTIFYEHAVARLMLLAASMVAMTGLVSVWTFIVRILSPERYPIGYATAIFVSLLGFSFLSIVLLVIFCLACAIFRLLMEQSRP